MKYSRVYLIDDDEDDQELFLLALEELMPSVLCTVHSNGEIALEALNAAIIQPDIIFLDLNMPLMTGQQFLAEMKKQGPDDRIPVIILSTSLDQATIKETKTLGATCFVTKPNNFNELKNILKRILE